MQGTKNLTEGPIRRQLFHLALPIMGTSFVQMAYSITDMAWVGRIGSEALAAVGVVGILTWITTSFSCLNKVGAEVSVAQSIGAQEEDEARAYASHNLTLALIISLCWGTLLFVFAEPVITLFKLEASIAARAVSYLRIIATGFPFIFLTASCTGIYNAAGLSRVPFFVSGTGLVMNMLLDPLFIFGFGMETNGAACATWLSQATVLCIFIHQLRHRYRLFGTLPFLTRLNRRHSLRIFRLGLPVALLNSLFAVINLMMARTAATYGGHIGVSTLTAGGQVEAIAWNTSQGFSTALSTFTAQNYAARKRERIHSAYRITLRMTTLLGILCTLLFIFFGSEIFSLIVPEQSAYEAGGVFLRIDGYSMVFMMLEITMQGLFYGTGRTVPPAIISITFNLLRIPIAIGLTATGLGVNGVWWAISLSSMAKGMVAFVWFRLLQKKIL